MDGIEAAEKIKARFSAPLVYLTAHSGKELLHRAKKTAPHGYLLKPFHPGELLAAIEMALANHALMESLHAKNQALEQALEKAGGLRGFLAICSYCKNIRNEKGGWENPERFIETHAPARISHSICPKCAEKFFPDLKIYDHNGLLR